MRNHNMLLGHVEVDGIRPATPGIRIQPGDFGASQQPAHRGSGAGRVQPARCEDALAD
jgi:hypothetical protein